jgi:hypothetical protein
MARNDTVSLTNPERPSRLHKAQQQERHRQRKNNVRYHAWNFFVFFALVEHTLHPPQNGGMRDVIDLVPAFAAVVLFKA